MKIISISKTAICFVYFENVVTFLFFVVVFVLLSGLSDLDFVR
jgi:hypothetical protein